MIGIPGAQPDQNRLVSGPRWQGTPRKIKPQKDQRHPS
jgi:hypothetical protein